MRARNAMRWLLVPALLLCLVGCTFIQAVTFQYHENSRYTARALTLKVGSSAGDQANQFTKDEVDYCSLPTGNALIGGVAAAAYTSVGSVIVSWISDEIGAYLDKKAKEFAPPAATANAVVPLFTVAPPAVGATAAVVSLNPKCMVLTQTVVDPKNPDGAGVEGFVFAARLEPIGNATSPAAYTLIPTFYRLSKSFARTGTDGKVDVTIGVALSVAAMGKDGPALQSFNATIALHSLRLPATNATAVGYGLATSGGIVQDTQRLLGSANQAGPLLLPDPTQQAATCIQPKTICSALFPTNLTATLTETGSGSPDFGTAKTEANDFTKGLSSAFSDAIKALTGKSP